MNKSSFKIWEGESKFNGDPVAAIATNLKSLSQNPKTGPMPQVWILSSSIPPNKAVWQDGGDVAVCGDCILAPHHAFALRDAGEDYTSCYVARRAYQAPLSVWKSNIGSPINLLSFLASLQNLGNPIRFGAYGEPSLLPQDLIDRIVSDIKHVNGKKTHTAYTHQHMNAHAYWLKRYAMASVENKWDGELFRGLGWRTFRITNNLEAGPNEIICPHITKGIQCIDCCLCDGRRSDDDNRKSITIPQH
jgi:hypothetical protein